MRKLLVLSLLALAGASHAVTLSLNSYSYSQYVGTTLTIYGTIDNTDGSTPVGFVDSALKGNISGTDLGALTYNAPTFSVAAGSSYTGALGSVTLKKAGTWKLSSFLIKTPAPSAFISYQTVAITGDATINAVPEPASLAALALGLVAVRRKVRK